MAISIETIYPGSNNQDQKITYKPCLRNLKSEYTYFSSRVYFTEEAAGLAGYIHLMNSDQSSDDIEMLIRVTLRMNHSIDAW